MDDSNKESSLSAAVLEDVFNEIDNLDNSVSDKANQGESKLLESLYKFEEELAAGDKISDKNKKRKSSDEIFKITEDDSVVHNGLTDSSDDEDNKYFEERKYNECGKNFKNLLENKKSFKNLTGKDSQTREDGWNRSSAKEKLDEALGKFAKKENGSGGCLSVDPVLGMRIINPLVSSAELKEKMIGRVAVGTSKIKNFLESPASKDSNWVTGGVVVSKSMKTSQKGNQYCLWHVTDLVGDVKTVSVFLFGSACKEHWKTTVGTVVGILNPTVMENSGKFEGSLRVDNAHKILLMGASKDFGLCRSKKKNGENCTSVVNKSKCDFCVYHMKKEYNKACRRSDLQPPKAGRSLDGLRAKFLGKNQICFGGKIFNGVVGKKSAKATEKDEKILKSLSVRNPCNLSESEKQKTKDILNRLSDVPEPSSAKKTPPQPRMIDLGFTVTRKERNAARANALKYVKEHGPLKPSSKGKKTPEQILAMKRKLEGGDEGESKKAKPGDEAPGDGERERRLKNGITDEFLKLMNAEVRNGELLKVAESEEREKYFDRLETKEKLENKMASTFKVPCKAVRCLKCNYKSFSASDLCKKEKHPLKVMDAVKRFWKCKECSFRTVCLELVPLHPCKNCGSPKWEKTSMKPEKKDGNLLIEPLSLRGHEEQFLGSIVKNANLSLLVPDEPIRT